MLEVGKKVNKFKFSVMFVVLILLIYFIGVQSTSAKTTLLSQDKLCTASSTYKDYKALKATDGDFWDGWIADPSQSTAYIYVDLGKIYSINNVRIYWGNYDYATSYKVQLSTNATTWVDKYWYNDGKGGIEDITFEETDARYVRIYCLEKKDWSYEIYEFQVYSGIQETEPVMQHTDNHAYLDSEWFDSIAPLTDNEIRDYVYQLKQYNIKYFFCDIGRWIKVDNKEKGGVEELHITASQYADLGHWIKITKGIDPNLKIIATINASMSNSGKDSYFVENTAPYRDKEFGKTVKGEVATLIHQLCKVGLYYDGTYYKVDGIHVDFEPFKPMYQTYFSEILTIARNNMEEGQHLSCAIPGKNGSWSNAYATSIIDKVDMVNPMIYDCLGPANWGTVSDGVAHNSSEYIQIIKDSCVWTSSLIRESNNKDCVLAPTLPVYEDRCEQTDEEGWPDPDSKYIWYHLNTIENMMNALKGIHQAIEEGANIQSAGIFWWPNFIGERPDIYDKYIEDQAIWMEKWVMY